MLKDKQLRSWATSSTWRMRLVLANWSYCLPAAPQTSGCPGGCPARRPGRREWGRPWCPWWPRCRPSAPSRRPACTCPSARRTSASPRRCPSRRGRSCSPGSDRCLERESKQMGECCLTSRQGRKEGCGNQRNPLSKGSKIKSSNDPLALFVEDDFDRFHQNQSLDK